MDGILNFLYVLTFKSPLCDKNGGEVGEEDNWVAKFRRVLSLAFNTLSSLHIALRTPP